MIWHQDTIVPTSYSTTITSETENHENISIQPATQPRFKRRTSHI